MCFEGRVRVRNDENIRLDGGTYPLNSRLHVLFCLFFPIEFPSARTIISPFPITEKQ